MRRSKRSLEGELYISHHGSPGVDPELAAWMGIDPKLVARGHVAELPVINCAHCQATVVLNPERTRERGWCAKCDKYLCDECMAVMHLTLRCNSMARQIDQAIDAIEHGTSPLLIPQL